MLMHRYSNNIARVARPPRWLVPALVAVTTVASGGAARAGTTPTTLFVDASSLANPERGTARAPYRTITAATAAANDGDTIAVLPGVYRENPVVATSITIEGVRGLGAEVRVGAQPWLLAADGVRLRGLRFVGDGAGTGIVARSAFAIEASQLESFATAIVVEAGGRGSVRRTRLLDCRTAVAVTGTGERVVIENNIMIGDGAPAGVGVLAVDANVLVAHNLISGFATAARFTGGHGFAAANLVVHGDVGFETTPASPPVLALAGNAVSTAAPTAGPIALEVATTDDDCGAPALEWEGYPHEFEPTGRCADGGRPMAGPAVAIGPYGGRWGGAWWTDLECAGPWVQCAEPRVLVDRWLDAHTSIADAIVWFDPATGWAPLSNWPQATRARLVDATARALGNRLPRFDDPPINVAAGTSFNPTTIALDDATAMFVGLTASSLAAEIGFALPWSLADYSPDQLAMLFDGRALFNEPPVCLATLQWLHGDSYGACDELGLGVTSWHNEVLPASPALVWSFLREHALIGRSRRHTIELVIDWTRYNLLHYFGAGEAVARYFWGYDGKTPLSTVISGTDPAGLHPSLNRDFGFGHWTPGCHGTTSVLRELLRVVNVPAERILIKGSGHRTIGFPSEDAYLSHGDDPYNALSKGAPEMPAGELLVDGATFRAWFGDAVAAAKSAANVGRRVKEVAARWLPTPLLELRCDDRARARPDDRGRVMEALTPAWTADALTSDGFWARLDDAIDDAGGCGALAHAEP